MTTTTKTIEELTAHSERVLDGEWKVDRTGWAPGPWDLEPDKIEWRYRGLPCLIVRSTVSGALCGYVGLPPGHPWHGRGYDDITWKLISVHGGLTYADSCAGPICHVPQEGESENVWWLGFDCAHYRDVSPGLRASVRQAYERTGETPPRGLIEGYGDFETYKNMFYVKAEAEALADQALRADTRYWRIHRGKRREKLFGKGMSKKQIKEQIHRNGRLRRRR